VVSTIPWPVTIDPRFVTSRSLSDDTIMSIEDRERKFFGVQFHPESILCEHGAELVTNFLDFCGVSTPPSR
jgi:para-aminobenzoate synthetase